MHLYIAVPATAALVLRAYVKKSLTPAGLVVAAVTAAIHALHPWSVFFVLLVVFFLGGTSVTKVQLPSSAMLMYGAIELRYSPSLTIISGQT